MSREGPPVVCDAQPARDGWGPTSWGREGSYHTALALPRGHSAPGDADGISLPRGRPGVFAKLLGMLPAWGSPPLFSLLAEMSLYLYFSSHAVLVCWI